MDTIIHTEEAHNTPRVDISAFMLLGALGILAIAVADTAARRGQDWAEIIFWLGLLLLFVPITVRLLMVDVTRTERIGLVVLLGLGLYSIKALHSPLYFTISDEFLHWRTANDILRTQHLFQNNALLPVSPFYPALEIATTGLVSLSGLTVYEAGILMLAAARLLFVLALYLFFERISRSSRIASIGVVLYMANPNFIFFNAEFSYESLAIPLGMTLLLILVQRTRAHAGMTLSLLLVGGALVITHHLTTYILIGFLFLWVLSPYIAMVTRFLLQRIAGFTKLPSARLLRHAAHALNIRPADVTPLTTPLLLTVVSLSWTVSAASLTIRYLAQPAVAGVTDFVKLVGGAGTSRQLFQDFSGLTSPLWERIVGFASVGLAAVLILIGLWALIRYRRINALTFVMAILALCYPATQALRLNANAWEIASRLTEFLFIAVAFIGSIGIVFYTPTAMISKTITRRIVGITLVIVIVLTGSLTSGWPRWGRLPGTYLVSADTRSVESESIAAAVWSSEHLGTGNQVASDRVNRLVMGTFGQQNIVTNISGQGNPAYVFMSSTFDVPEKTFIKNLKLQYLVVDRRLSTGLPVLGIYFERGEPDTYQHTLPIRLDSLIKFDGDPQVSHLFDSGSIIIYNVSHVIACCVIW